MSTNGRRTISVEQIGAVADLASFDSSHSTYRWSSNDMERIRRIDFRGARILLVDDSDDNRQLFSRILSAAGARIDIACDGNQAVEMQARGEFAAIIMDIQMPILDGCNASLKIRSQGYEGPIVALTAHASAAEARRCLDSGCSQFLAKPIDRLSLLTAIQSAIGDVGARA